MVAKKNKVNEIIHEGRERRGRGEKELVMSKNEEV